MDKLSILMKRERHCKNSVVYKSETKDNPNLRSIYLMNAGYKELKEPASIVVTVEKA